MFATSTFYGGRSTNITGLESKIVTGVDFKKATFKLENSPIDLKTKGLSAESNEVDAETKKLLAKNGVTEADIKSLCKLIF